MRCILKSLLASSTSNNIQFLQAHAAPLASTLGERLLHTQVPRGRGLTWAAGDWRDWQAAEKEVHGGQQGLQKTDGAESRASMWGKVDFIGIGAGWLKERLILTAGAEGKEAKKGLTKSLSAPDVSYQISINICFSLILLMVLIYIWYIHPHPLKSWCNPPLTTLYFPFQHMYLTSPVGGDMTTQFLLKKKTSF